MITSDCLAGLTAEDLYHPDPPPVPLAGHLHPRQLGPGEHLRELGVLGAQVLSGGKYLELLCKNICTHLVQVPADGGGDLERAEEGEEDSEEDVEAADDEGGHRDDGTELSETGRYP